MTEDLKLNTNAYLPLRDVVFHTLREAILKGELKPGERLMELQLAAKLGVSRTPIREAIRMLEQEGLAVTIPRRGAEDMPVFLSERHFQRSAPDKRRPALPALPLPFAAPWHRPPRPHRRSAESHFFPGAAEAIPP